MKRLSLFVAAVALVVAYLLFLEDRRANSQSSRTSLVTSSASLPQPQTPNPRPQTPSTAAEHSPIADALNAPTGTIRHDLEILNEVFGAWQTNFPHEGNPVGENAEITAALVGQNKFHFAFIAPTHSAINARGELCDRWGTPFFFHSLSGTQMEIRSAGPDKKLWTSDDVASREPGAP